MTEADFLQQEQVQFLLNGNQYPVVISFRDIHNKLVSTPVWCYYHEGKLYFFSSKKSMKVRSIEAGHDEFSVLIINKNAYVVIRSEDIPYISMTGTMRIVTNKEVPAINRIHINLLQKYNPPNQEIWVQELIDKLEEEPKDTWMLQFQPQTFRTY